MPPLQVRATKKVHLFLLVLCASNLVLSSADTSTSTSIELLGRGFLGQKHVLGLEDSSTTPNALGTTLPTTKKNSSKTSKDSSFQEKPTSKTTNSTIPISKNTNPAKPSSVLSQKTNKDSSFQEKPTTKTTNSTKPISKNTNHAKPTSVLSQKTNKDSSFLEKPTTKTTNSTKPFSKNTNLAKPTSVLSQKTNKDSSFQEKPKPKTTNSTKPTSVLSQKTKNQEKKPIKSLKWAYEDDDEEEDLVSGFKDLPSRFQETILPDLELLSSTSKAYLNEANQELTNGIKPIMGKKYAPILASILSFTLILTPFLLLPLVFNQLKPYFSLEKTVNFIQTYLSIYFFTLFFSSMVTGVEPLKFFYAASESAYICIMSLQTAAYVLYLALLLLYFVAVFWSGTAANVVALGQVVVGFTVGIHYYMTVFHRAVLRQPPKSSWRVHAVYATCFFLIGLLGRVGRRKKGYVVDGEEGKMN